MRVNDFGYSRYFAHKILNNMYDMKTKTYHFMHQIEQVSVSVASNYAQTKGHGRVHVKIR